MTVTPIRECECCGERKPDVCADGAGAYQCEECLCAAELEAELEAAALEDRENDDDG